MASEFLATHAESSFTMRPRSSYPGSPIISPAPPGGPGRVTSSAGVSRYRRERRIRSLTAASSRRRAARCLASAARRFLVPASLGLLAILGLNDTAYTFQGRAMTAVTSPPSNEASATLPLGICDRTKQVRDAIVAKIPGVRNCTKVTDAQMAQIKRRLRLENTQIGSLQAGDFAGLPNLVEIRLDGNQLSRLPDGVFDGLSSLTKLDLSDNQLSTLPSDVFDGLSSLTELDLNNNRLSSLPPDVFDGLSSLLLLMLIDNRLSTLPSDVFDGLSSLEWLMLGENRLSSLPPDVFDGLSSLVWLILEENQLSSLPSDVFDELSSLRKLDLEANQLSSLPSDVFDGLSSLEWLRLRINRLSSLPSDVFDGLSSLTKLDLRENRLSSLSSDVFDGLSLLEDLLLDRNQLTLTGLPSDVFEGLSSLEMLNLQHNRLSSLPDGVFEGLSSLEWLLLYKNPVDPLPLTVSLEEVGDSGFKATVPAGAPFTMTFSVSVTNGNIVGGATTLTIPVGAVESGILSVTRAVGTTDAVTVDIGAPLPRLPESYHQGYALAKATDLPREILADDETPLTAAFEGLQEAHDGEDAFRVRVAFSEDIGISFRSMRDESFTVSGGEVTGARRVDGRHDLWEITVAPDSDGDVTIALPAGRACAVSGAICTRGGDRRQLANTPTATVAGPVDEAAPAALTASFVEAPYEHDGETAFKLRIGFSEGISIGFRTFRDQSVSATGGGVTKAKRVDRRKDLWEITVEPDTNEAVTLTLAGGRACGTAGAVCTGDGRALSAGISTTVLGPAALTVADARAQEGTDETIDFTVSLSRATRAAVTVAYATADGTATAGSDYTATSGTLTFAAGETEQTVSVPVLDDAHDEGEETLTLRLSNATGAVIADGEATGTIKNTDHIAASVAGAVRTHGGHARDGRGGRAATGRLGRVPCHGGRLPAAAGEASDGHCRTRGHHGA